MVLNKEVTQVQPDMRCQIHSVGNDAGENGSVGQDEENVKHQMQVKFYIQLYTLVMLLYCLGVALPVSTGHH